MQSVPDLSSPRGDRRGASSVQSARSVFNTHTTSEVLIDHGFNGFNSKFAEECDAVA